MLCANHKVKGWFSTHVETLPTWNHTCAVQLSLLPYMAITLYGITIEGGLGM